jgi:MYXO-CTERM domain-containing protein
MRVTWIKLLAVSLSALAFGLGRPSVAVACTCYPQGEEDGSLRTAQVVFEGTPMGEPEEVPSDRPGPRSSYDLTRYRFRVHRFFKEHLGAELEILSEDWRAGCGNYFEAGTKYLVYANYDEEGALVSSLCSLTGRSEQQERAFAVLGAGTPPDGAEQDVVLADAASEDGGCSVAASAGPASRGAPLILGAALLLGAARRRRERRRGGWSSRARLP